MLVSVVIPCYNSQHTIKTVVELTIQEFQKMPEYSYEFVLVNDYSKDQTFLSIKELAQKYPFVKGINLARNFGQHNALMAALHYAQGDLIVGMDDDLQTHPSQMYLLLDKMKEGYDLVYGNYDKRKNSFLKNLSSKFNAVTSRIYLDVLKRSSPVTIGSSIAMSEMKSSNIKILILILTLSFTAALLKLQMSPLNTIKELRELLTIHSLNLSVFGLLTGIFL